jgi:multiple sugar transport system permease protein
VTTTTAPITPVAPASPGAPVDTPRRRGRAVRRALTPYAFLLPALVMELLVHLVPMAVGVWISFRELTQFFIRRWSEAPFVGLENYRVVLDWSGPTGADLVHSLFVTIVYTVCSVGLSWLFGFTAGVLLQKRFRGRNVLRTMFLTPYALPAYAAVITWSFLLQRDQGMLNHILVDQLHLVDERPFWLIGDNSLWSLIMVAVWRTWPFALLCITAGLQAIPPDLYEASAMDGAGFLRQVREVTLPMLAPVNRVLILVLVLWSFNDFSTPFVLFGGSAPRPAELISIHIYESSFITWNFGLGSAMSVLLLLFLFVVTVVYLLAVNRRRRDA